MLGARVATRSLLPLVQPSSFSRPRWRARWCVPRMALVVASVLRVLPTPTHMNGVCAQLYSTCLAWELRACALLRLEKCFFFCVCVSVCVCVCLFVCLFVCLGVPV